MYMYYILCSTCTDYNYECAVLNLLIHITWDCLYVRFYFVYGIFIYNNSNRYTRYTHLCYSLLANKVGTWHFSCVGSILFYQVHFVICIFTKVAITGKISDKFPKLLSSYSNIFFLFLR